MKKLILTIGIVAILSSLGTAWILLEISTNPELLCWGDDCFHLRWVNTQWTGEGFLLYTTWGNQSTEQYIAFWENGNITLNGKGICLDDGTSTTGGRCRGLQGIGVEPVGL